MGFENVNITYDPNSIYPSGSIKSTGGSYYQIVLLATGSATDPQLLNPATEDTLSTLNSTVSGLDIGLTNIESNTTDILLDTSNIDTNIVDISGFLSDINDNLTPLNTDVETSRITVTDTEVQLTASLTGVRTILITNMSDITGSSEVLYIGKTGITDSIGFPLRGGESLSLDSTISWYGICSSGESVDVGIMELK